MKTGGRLGESSMVTQLTDQSFIVYIYQNIYLADDGNRNHIEASEFSPIGILVFRMTSIGVNA